MVVASEQATFGTTEVRLGLIPAVIGPYVLAAIGPRHARRLMLTGERISAAEAHRLGLVHEVVAPEQLDPSTDRIVGEILKSGPDAIAAAKRLIRDLSGRPIEPSLIDATAQRIAALRATSEAREGVGAFLQKRAPAWLS
jgi:methylglutaconyl-CoA hydratase